MHVFSAKALSRNDLRSTAYPELGGPIRQADEP